MGRASVTLPEQVISGHVCPLGGHRKQVAVLIVLTPNSCPSWREFRSDQEVSALLCPPRFTTSSIHNNLRYMASKGNCLGILTVPYKLSSYLAERAECCCCRVCLGLQLESSRITKNSVKKKEKYFPIIHSSPSFKIFIKVLGKKTTKTQEVLDIFLETMICFYLVSQGLRMSVHFLLRPVFIVFVATAPSVVLDL